MSTRIGLGPVTHVGAIGVAHQPSAVPLPIPALAFSQLERGLQTGYQTSQGLEVALPWQLTASATGFLHTYTGLVDLSGSGRGRAFGLELMLRTSLTRRLGGWVSYTLSRSTRVPDDARDRGAGEVVSSFDRTHVLNAVVALDFGSGWRAGGHYAGYSGIPYSTTQRDGIPDARTPAFHRLDLRFEKRFALREQGRHLAFTIEMFNALLAKEVVGVSCDGAGGCKPQEVGPITIPSIGLEGTL